MKYIVIELQDNESTVGNQVWAYDSVFDAQAKYHSILAVAATSNVPCHSAVLLNSEGQYIDSKPFKHGQE